jgi:hypothetical protein
VTVEGSEGYGEDPEAFKLHIAPLVALSRDARSLAHGGNGGYQAINLAYLAGAARIVLLGYDMKHRAAGKTGTPSTRSRSRSGASKAGSRHSAARARARRRRRRGFQRERGDGARRISAAADRAAPAARGRDNGRGRQGNDGRRARARRGLRQGEEMMGYLTNGLTFNALRGANAARLPEFKDKHGRLAHSKADGSDWSPAQWLQAVLGELGEYANVRKKYERGDLTAEEFQALAEKELADVQTYLDILARRCLDRTGAGGAVEWAHPTGVDLGQATIDKFNEVSARVGSSVRLAADDWHRLKSANQVRAEEAAPE